MEITRHLCTVMQLWHKKKNNRCFFFLIYNENLLVCKIITIILLYIRRVCNIECGCCIYTSIFLLNYQCSFSGANSINQKPARSNTRASVSFVLRVEQNERKKKTHTLKLPRGGTLTFARTL